MNFKQYIRYFIIGTFVGITAIFFREMIAKLLPVDNPNYYVLSVTVTYVFAIMLSFTMQRFFTFQPRQQHSKEKMFACYTLVAITGGISTAVLSFIFRYTLQLDLFLYEYSGATAFAAAALASSVLTYWLNVRFVFNVP